MFASLLRSKKKQPSETTPLLAALHRYRSRQNGEPSEAADDDYPGVMIQYDGEDEDEDEHRRRDGPLLPVFAATVLGKPSKCYNHCLQL
jgi:hypothetical protein